MAKAGHTRSSGVHISDIGLPPHAPPSNHGKTSAAWMTTLLVTLGGIICAVGFILGSTVLAIAGAAVMVIGLAVGRIMRAMGLGQRSTSSAGGAANTSAPHR